MRTWLLATARKTCTLYGRDTLATRDRREEILRGLVLPSTRGVTREFSSCLPEVSRFRAKLGGQQRIVHVWGPPELQVFWFDECRDFVAMTSTTPP